MVYNLVVLSQAILEIEDALDWYEEQKYGLGYELLDEIDFCYLKLTKRPEHYSYINASYRRIKTERFPYVLIYSLNGDTVTVNSFRHVKRKPL